MYLSLNLTRRLLLLVCLLIVGFFIVSVLTLVIGIDSTPKIRILTMMQDIMIFILPAVVTALLITRQPATLLAIDRRPTLKPTLMAIAALLASIPAMNIIILLNNSLPLPEDLAVWTRSLEDAAAGTVALMSGPHNIPNLLMSIMIIGVMAGLSEELLFRGCMQRLLVTARVNPHLAIWLVAAIFSLVHLQFYGFVPRMLLGAMFGYALYLTDSLWIPIIMHIFNNTIYLINEYISPSEMPVLSDVSVSDIIVAIVSAIVTIVLMFGVKRVANLPDQQTQNAY